MLVIKTYTQYHFVSACQFAIRIVRSSWEISWVSMGFYVILCLCSLSAPKDSYCMIIMDYLSVVFRRSYAFIIYIMSQSPFWLF